MVYTFFGMMRAPLVFEAWQRAGLLLHQVLVWNKSRVVLSRSDYCWNYEPIAYGWIRGARPRAARRPPANATAVWAGLLGHPGRPPGTPHLQARRAHPPAHRLSHQGRRGDVRALLRFGHGPHRREMTGRVCRALEISPAYCDVAVKRWEAFTGRKALRDGARDES